MKMEFIFRYACADATTNYDVVVSEPCNVGQLIELILQRSAQKEEYGDIWIRSTQDNIYLLSYKNGKRDRPLFWIKDYDENILNKYKDKRVVKIFANGGYTAMSYDIFLESA